MGTLLQLEMQCPSTFLITRQDLNLRNEILPSTSANSVALTDDVFTSDLPGLGTMSKQEKLTTPIPYLMRNYCFHGRVRISLSLPQHAGTPIRPAFVLVPGTHEVEVCEFKNLDLFFIFTAGVADGMYMILHCLAGVAPPASLVCDHTSALGPQPSGSRAPRFVKPNPHTFA
jgi:hypothetical protein